MCAYTHYRNKHFQKIKKFLKGGARLHRTSQNISVFAVKDTAKTIKDLGMSCYILVKYSVFFPLEALL